jgi:hypothetical protein
MMENEETLDVCSGLMQFMAKMFYTLAFVKSVESYMKMEARGSVVIKVLCDEPEGREIEIRSDE